MTALGRLLQIVGLVALPLAIVMQLTGLGVRDMLMITIAGAALFYLGRVIEGYSRRGE